MDLSDFQIAHLIFNSCPGSFLMILSIVGPCFIQSKIFISQVVSYLYVCRVQLDKLLTILLGCCTELYVTQLSDEFPGDNIWLSISSVKYLPHLCIGLCILYFRLYLLRNFVMYYISLDWIGIGCSYGGIPLSLETRIISFPTICETWKIQLFVKVLWPCHTRSSSISIQPHLQRSASSIKKSLLINNGIVKTLDSLL